MNIRRSWAALALLLVTIAAVGLSVPATLAYSTAKTETLVNTFTVLRLPPAQTSVNVCVQKTVHNTGTKRIGPEGFSFSLQNTQTGEAFVLTSDADGLACVTLPFSEADMGKTHTYRLSEINDGRENVSYSDQVYAIEIALCVDANKQPVASARVDGVPVQQIVAAFENEYHAGDVILPPTGDDSSLGLYIALLLVSGAGLALLLIRRNRQALK